ncbi:phage tail protein [Bartonella krasnovii]|uniref:phage tail protein n=1 Tax=Bartonella krasnovii TaxID=2267275 RepID=UPI001F4CF798|nr:phage tail protein [Bartonella krasnovii]UNF39640.1 phage tail protein [Bartonella krasnovii]UNF43017.1 phage tail protein [Bartonella krasnovii]UNF46063.1 phage tail protein [Bartonella krasnovii]UNF47738.1 phage tail protein [Bartonella krasnovii]UNF51184.1 phage tail protein [Bartonella krasnovii]
MSTIYDWSLTASENGSADSLINWSEGQHPNTVNNSARFMMQRVKEYLLDTGGTLEGIVMVDDTQKTSAIRLLSQSQFLEYKNGLSICFKAKGKNVGSTTVSLNALAGKPVYKATDSGLLALSGGEIQEGCLYRLVYDEEITGWQILNPTREKASSLKRLPSGLIGPFAMERLPEGWLPCDGGAYLRRTYRALFDAIGTVWGEGDGVSTFNVPDFRGMFLRGLDYERGLDLWRSFASVQACSLKAHEHLIGPASSVEHSSRKKRDVSSSEASLTRRRRDCTGLQVSAVECEKIIESFMKEEVPFWFTKKDKPPRLPWFIRDPFASFLYHSEPIKEGINDRGHHEHHLMTERVGGVETRPVNVSIIYGIKT